MGAHTAIRAVDRVLIRNTGITRSEDKGLKGTEKLLRNRRGKGKDISGTKGRDYLCTAYCRAKMARRIKRAQRKEIVHTVKTHE